MRAFKHRHFQQWAKSEKLTDEVLLKAVEEMGRGLHDGDLGGGLYKKRVAQAGRGKRGSYRTLLAFKRDEKALFVYGYAKKDKANVSAKERAVYKDLAKRLLGLDDKTIKLLLERGSLLEIKLDEKEVVRSSP